MQELAHSAPTVLCIYDLNQKSVIHATDVHYTVNKHKNFQYTFFFQLYIKV